MARKQIEKKCYGYEQIAEVLKLIESQNKTKSHVYQMEI